MPNILITAYGKIIHHFFLAYFPEEKAKCVAAVSGIFNSIKDGKALYNEE
jgi:hypothetical protein